MGALRQPVRIVVTRRLDIPKLSHLARSARDVPLWLCHGPDADPALIAAWEAIGARLIPGALVGRQLDLRAVLQDLGRAGLTRVLCEGGGGLAASLLGAGLVDRLVGFGAGLVIGADGVPAVGAMGIARLQDAPRFELADTRRLGGDVMQDWRRI
jgi:diaminohydroxyphosphoribosylaminopyrimidine deaminase/5-amino-6-(5-phosphoribosylamino)uracil reductase